MTNNRLYDFLRSYYGWWVDFLFVEVFNALKIPEIVLVSRKIRARLYNFNKTNSYIYFYPMALHGLERDAFYQLAVTV